jgi:tetraprenyl-beta-curcumene synthase
VVVRCRRRVVEANAFAGAAAVYWLEVFPQVRSEVADWRRRAELIPEPRLARLALATQDRERGNLEGSAAFALLAPRRRRAEVITAAVAFQALYDFLDTLAELPVPDPLANGRSLHRALLAALDPALPSAAYLEHTGFAGDGGYIEALVRRCRGALAALPGYPAIAAGVRQAAARMLYYQGFNHGQVDHAAMRRWARALTPAGSGLEWWETAAGAASSLGVFALLAAAAARPDGAIDARAAADAYFPWVGALHVLLDSLVDRDLDLRRGEHSLVDHYAGPQDAAERLGAIAHESGRRLEELDQGPLHALILASMAGFYLSRPAASGSFAAPASSRVLSALGPAARPAAAILRIRAALCPTS